MKLLLVVLSLLSVSLSCYSKNDIPPKLKRNVKIEKDEFTGNTMYSSTRCCLHIEDVESDIVMYISFKCNSGKIPISISKIQALADKEVININYKESELDSRLVEESYKIQNSTGNPISGTYRSSLYNTREAHIHTWKANANDYIDVINKLLSSKKRKVKITGSNGSEYIYDIDYDQLTKMKNMTALYDYLRENKAR